MRRAAQFRTEAAAGPRPDHNASQGMRDASHLYTLSQVSWPDMEV